MPMSTPWSNCCYKAVVKLLLQKRSLNSGVAITGGVPLDTTEMTKMARAATRSQTDVVHLQFGDTETGEFSLCGLTAVVPRDSRCFVCRDCRLWMPEGGARAVIIP